MEPRGKTSGDLKWTAVPKDYAKQVITALKDSFADEAKSGKFIVEGKIYAKELLLRIGFLEKGRLRQQNFEISIDYKPGKDDAYKILNLAVDVGATMMEELFSATDDSEFPRVWQPYEVEGRTIYLQFSSTNSELDHAADQFLAQQQESSAKSDPLQSLSLVQGGKDDELHLIKNKLGLDDENQDEVPKPKKH